MFRAPQEQCFLAVVPDEDRSGVTVIALDRSLIIARDLPTHLAGKLVERGEPRAAVVHHGHHHVFLCQDRRRAVVPVQRVPAKPLHQIRLPTQFAA